MRTLDILAALPATSQWMVMFRLAAMRTVADEATLKAAFFLPPSCDLDQASHAVLTSHGRYLAGAEALYDPAGLQVMPCLDCRESLAGRFARQLKCLPCEEADCVGMGQLPPYPPVLLRLRVADGFGNAQALFFREPDGKHFELLRAVGVEY